MKTILDASREEKRDWVDRLEFWIQSGRAVGPHRDAMRAAHRYLETTPNGVEEREILGLIARLCAILDHLDESSVALTQLLAKHGIQPDRRN